MLSHKALAARMRLMRKMGFTEVHDGDLRLVCGPLPGDERVTQAAPAPRFDTEKIANDPYNAADLVLNPPPAPVEN